MALLSLEVAVLSVELDFLAGGVGLGVGSGTDVADGFLGVCEFILSCDLPASFVENIRVNRFVIDGLSEARTAGAGF